MTEAKLVEIEAAERACKGISWMEMENNEVWDFTDSSGGPLATIEDDESRAFIGKSREYVNLLTREVRRLRGIVLDLI